MFDPEQAAKRLRKLKDQKKEAQAYLDAVKHDIAEYEMWIRDELDSMSAKSIKTIYGTIGIREEDVPTIADYDTFIEFARRKGNTDLLQRRISAAAWKERIANGKVVPGVTTFTRRTVFLHK